jgi:hypothetical protein
VLTSWIFVLMRLCTCALLLRNAHGAQTWTHKRVGIFRPMLALDARHFGVVAFSLGAGMSIASDL